MVMDQFVTTYRKDYLWPYVRVLGHKPQLPQFTNDKVLCECHCLPSPRPTHEQRTAFGPNALKEQAWSRLGPMGPLLDPKLYPAKVGSAPESETMRFNQPNVFLKKLQEKYPFIYECLREAPPDDLISRINKDRLRTTYQVDYCKLQEYPTAPYEELLRAAGVEGLPPCPEPVRLPGDPCRPNQKPIAYRPSSMSKTGTNAQKSCGGNLYGGSGPVYTRPISSNNTEYQDVISKLGSRIIREKLFSSRNKH